MLKKQRILAVATTLWFLLQPVSGQATGREYEEAGKPEDTAKVLKFMPEGTEALELMMPMRDGVSLATSIFLPPGDEPRPVLFCKGYYGRSGMAGYARPCQDGGLVFVAQDARGRGKSEGVGTFDASSFEDETQDLEDALEWIAQQPWCDGRIVMTGGSGNGINPSVAVLTGSPHLRGVSVGSTSGVADHWMFENGARRWLYSWMKHRGMKIEDWPRPTVGPRDDTSIRNYLAQQPVNPQTVYVAGGGWFDILSEAALDYFEALHDKMPVYVTIEPRTHAAPGKIDGKAWPRPVKVRRAPTIEAMLAGTAGTEKSWVQYFLMGDVNRPDGPGNTWRVTETWPPPAEKTAYYFQPDGGLSSQTPPDSAAPETYLYDPADPAPAIGGNATYDLEAGPSDQRPLAERDDVLRFATAPLDEPVAVAGPVQARLSFATDAPDTLFIVKLVDIYPDGYEAVIRESAALGRFAIGLDGDTPLQPDQVYSLAIDLGSTAIVFDEGHRIGAYVTSSGVRTNARGQHIETFEVHPNRFEPVTDESDFQTARQSISIDRAHPSGLLLPVISLEEN